jgi:hypothetical protein
MGNVDESTLSRLPYERIADSGFKQFVADGYVMLESIFGVDEIDSVGNRLAFALEAEDRPSTLRSRGQTYGSRNLLETFPEVRALLKKALLREFAVAVLGPNAGIVRALYFDKPPNRSWSLPWHRDRTIAVKRNDLPSEHFQKPTTKAEVPHVEAPAWLLNNMLTLRIHLDAMTVENGPLCVIPASHHEDDVGERRPIQLHAHAGDVLAMRPLLSHSSAMPTPGTTSHRRVAHIELAGTAELPDRYEWYSFLPLV